MPSLQQGQTGKIYYPVSRALQAGESFLAAAANPAVILLGTHSYQTTGLPAGFPAPGAFVVPLTAVGVGSSVVSASVSSGPEVAFIYMNQSFSVSAPALSGGTPVFVAD